MDGETIFGFSMNPHRCLDHFVHLIRGEEMTTYAYKTTNINKKIMDVDPRNIRQHIRVGDKDILVYNANNNHMIFHDVQNNKVCASTRFGFVLTGHTEDSITFYHTDKKCFVTRKFNFDMDESELS